jgi:hypothetical protein
MRRVLKSVAPGAWWRLPRIWSIESFPGYRYGSEKKTIRSDTTEMAMPNKALQTDGLASASLRQARG